MHEFDESKVRQQARAAARIGKGAEANPFLLAENMPDATGETLSDWTHRHDIWHEAYRDALRPRPSAAKEVMTSALLVTLLSRRVRWIPEVQQALASQPGTHVRIGRPAKQARDEHGRNWDVTGFECGAVDANSCLTTFRQIVDRLRDEYDVR